MYNRKFNRKSPFEVFVTGFIILVFVLVVGAIAYGVTASGGIDPDCFVYKCVKIK